NSTAQSEGKLLHVAVGEREPVRVGEVIAQIETAAAPAAAPSKGKESDVDHAEVPPEGAGGRAPVPVASPVPDAVNGGERQRLSPAVRKLASEHGIDPSSLRGS